MFSHTLQPTYHHFHIKIAVNCRCSTQFKTNPTDVYPSSMIVITHLYIVVGGGHQECLHQQGLILFEPCQVDLNDGSTMRLSFETCVNMPMSYEKYAHKRSQGHVCICICTHFDIQHAYGIVGGFIDFVIL